MASHDNYKIFMYVYSIVLFYNLQKGYSIYTVTKTYLHSKNQYFDKKLERKIFPSYYNSFNF